MHSQQEAKTDKKYEAIPGDSHAGAPERTAYRRGPYDDPLYKRDSSNKLSTRERREARRIKKFD
jgi:hypothetical protein